MSVVDLIDRYPCGSLIVILAILMAIVECVQAISRSRDQ